ncbi:MAG TPA: hypothetical protein VHZ51_30380 [Ktedonobacteraceae bacterium]|nr:hypothetical protein [Ktedonobacteraceae bacterium]
MKATTEQTQSSMAMYPRCAERMPFTLPTMGMFAASAAASIIFLKTGALTPVSLFALLIIVALLLVGFELIISLLLTCLTGLTRLEGLVRHITKIATSDARGD